MAAGMEVGGAGGMGGRWGWGERKTQKQRSSDYISCGEHDDTKTKDVLRGKDLSLCFLLPPPTSN